MIGAGSRLHGLSIELKISSVIDAFCFENFAILFADM